MRTNVEHAENTLTHNRDPLHLVPDAWVATLAETTRRYNLALEHLDRTTTTRLERMLVRANISTTFLKYVRKKREQPSSEPIQVTFLVLRSTTKPSTPKRGQSATET
jgi:hypothetical protein